jgi:hypothetical protein
VKRNSAHTREFTVDLANLAVFATTHNSAWSPQPVEAINGKYFLRARSWPLDIHTRIVNSQRHYASEPLLSELAPCGCQPWTLL